MTTPRFDAAALRHAREAAGLTRADLAKLVGTDSDMVGLWEEGGVTPAPGRMKKTAHAVGLSVDDLWRPAEDDSPLAVLRVRAGFTQRSLAQRLGVSQAQMSRLELGQAKIGSELAAAVAEALDAAVDEVAAAADAVRAETVDPDPSDRDEARPPALADLRVAAGLSQAELADIVGSNPTSVSRHERGKQWFHSERLPDYAKALGVSVMDVARAVDQTRLQHGATTPKRLNRSPSDFWVGPQSPHALITQERPRSLLARVTSPQHPRLDLPLRLEGVSMAEGMVVKEHMGVDGLHRFNHAQLRERGPDPDDAVYLVRWQLNAHDGLKRYKDAANVSLHIPGWRRHPDRAPRHKLASGEFLLIVVDARDPLWWVSNQLAEGEAGTLIPNYPRRGPGFVVAVEKDESGELVVLDSEGEPLRLKSLGLDPESTHRNLTEALRARQPAADLDARTTDAEDCQAEQFDAYYGEQLAKPRP